MQLPPLCLIIIMTVRTNKLEDSREERSEARHLSAGRGPFQNVYTYCNTHLDTRSSRINSLVFN